MTREIPLWGLLTLLGAFAAQAVALYYGQQEQARELKRQGDRQIEMATDLRSFAVEASKNNREMLELAFTVRTLDQRVRLIEQQTARSIK